MLETLDDIPWRNLKHAYGPAEDVPELIRAVAFGNAEARASAWHQLYGNLWHQGTVYEASSHAVPFLLEIAADDAAPDLHDVIVYLASLASGSSYLAVHQHLIYPAANERPPSEVEEQMAQELQWVRQAHEAVRRGLLRYLSLLDHDDSLVRSASCHVLGCFPEEIASVLPRLLRRFGDGDEDVGARAACVLAIGKISWTSGSCPEEARRALDGAESLAVRAIAAIVVALFDRAGASNELRTFVAKLAADYQRFEAVLRLFPWDAGNPPEYLVPALSAVGAGDGRPVGLLVEALRQSDPVMSQYCVEFLCAVAFQSMKAPDTSSDLSPHQWRALTAIADADTFWRWAAGSGRIMAAETLKDYDLPASREELQAYLTKPRD